MKFAFSDAVKAEQQRRGSRATYARVEARGGFATAISDELADWLAQQDSIYLATASADGQPYIQHRGGPPGFLRVVDAHTLAFIDQPGNRQYITLGNMSENDRVCVFVMDYANRERVKIWGRARVVEEPGSERVIVIAVTAWDANCPKYIPQR
jgi:uncharacterized protein